MILSQKNIELYGDYSKWFNFVKFYLTEGEESFMNEFVSCSTFRITDKDVIYTETSKKFEKISDVVTF